MDDKTQELSDSDVALLMMEGDPEGLRLLLERHGPKVLGFLERSYGGSLFEGEALDVLYRAAYRVWENATSYDEEKGELGPWFLTIAQRQAMSVFRERKWSAAGSETRVPLEEATQEIEEAQRRTENDEDAGDDELAAAFEEEVAKLPGLQRAIIEGDLASGTGVANSRVLAERLGSSWSAVRTLRTRARARLREALSKRGFEVKAWRDLP